MAWAGRPGGRDGAGGRASVRSAVFASPLRALRRGSGVGWSDGLVGLRHGLAASIDHEVASRRLFPWIAVTYGIGILIAFAADTPLSSVPPLMTGIVLAAAAVLSRHRFPRFVALVAAASLCFGFAAAVIRLGAVEAPVLQRLTMSRLEGFVESVEERPTGGRVVIRPVKLAGIDEAARPARVRVTVRALAGIAPGDYVTGAARLLPPPEAARPGGYDFARDAYFRGIGAVGSISGKIRRIDPAPSAPGVSLKAAAWVDSGRNALTTRIAGAIGGQAGAVSAALVTGKRGLIDEHTNDILRAAGIYHIVSISGLHMVLAAGVFFWVTRALLALSPALVLGWPIKKVAALVGMAGASAYCVFSGADVATERSLLMILVMQGAILVDRPALSLRNLAVSALLVLTREPEAVLGPSFQMSYAAVAGLIAFAEWQRARRPRHEAGDHLRRIALWVGGALAGILGTTLVATLATGPFSAFHFQNLQPYGLIGNAATLPLVSLAVMPAAVIGVVALPFGLDRPVWIAMGWATQAVLHLSEWVAGFPSATMIVPAYGAAALGLLTLAILCATLFGSALRWMAIVPATLGALLAWSVAKPDVYVARDGAGVAVRGQDGRLAIMGRVPSFTVEQWLKADGDARRAGDPTLTMGARCDRIGCTIALADGQAVSYLTDRRGLARDCARAVLVVTRFAAPSGCSGATLIDTAFRAGHGATALRTTPTGFDIRSARRPGETRPWLANHDASARRVPIGKSARDRSTARPEPRPTTDRPADGPSRSSDDSADP